MDIKTAKTEELAAERARLNAQADEARRAAKAIQAELDFRAAIKEYEELSEPQKRALAHVIGAAGIGSTAKVGTPGE